MRLKLKELLRKGRGIGNKDRKLQVRQYMEGWINFFQAADMKSLMTLTFPSFIPETLFLDEIKLRWQLTFLMREPHLGESFQVRSVISTT